MPPIAMSALRSATETVVPTTCSISAVSAVIREEISLGAVLLEEARATGAAGCVCTARRMSATTRSPSHETK